MSTDCRLFQQHGTADDSS